jgi:hypothetical protein
MLSSTNSVAPAAAPTRAKQRRLIGVDDLDGGRDCPIVGLDGLQPAQADRLRAGRVDESTPGLEGVAFGAEVIDEQHRLARPTGIDL